MGRLLDHVAYQGPATVAGRDCATAQDALDLVMDVFGIEAVFGTGSPDSAVRSR
jgi:hypothetical protein